MDKYLIIFLSTFLVIALVLIFIIYKKRYNDGIKDFMSLLFKFGFESKVRAFNIQNKFVSKNGILFLGDSITQDYNVYEYFSSYNVYNRGIGGDTTVGLGKRLKESVYDLMPKTIILLIGTNDLALFKTTPIEIKNRIENIINEILTELNKVNILLLSVLPVNEIIDPATVKPRTNDDIILLNKELIKIKGVKYLNIYDYLLDDNHKLAKEYTYDGLHLNEEGYLILTNILKQELKED